MLISFSIARTALAAVWLAALCAPLWAAEPLTLAQAQRMAEQRSQQLPAQDALSAAAREQAVAAGQWPDPVLKLGLDNVPTDGPDKGSLTRDFMTMRRIGIMQELPRAAKRQLKAERFERDAQRAVAQRQWALANLRRDTALAWLDAYYSQAMRQLVQQQLTEAGLQVQAADAAFRTGRGSQSDVFAARSAVLQLEDRLSQVDRQERNASLQLGRWIGTPAAQRPQQGLPAWQTLALQEADVTTRLQQHPELQVMQAEVDAAETEARLAEANKQADWSVGASYAQRGPAYSNMLSVGVSIPLQWDQKNRQNREVSAKLALVDEARARFDEMLRTHEAEVRAGLNDWQTGKARVARYQDQLLPTAQQRVAAALTAYRTGKGDLTSALVARRDEVDTRLQALNLELETARSWAQLQFLLPIDGVQAQEAEMPVKEQP